MLPDYLSKASPNPASNRAPWYANTAPTYAGIFLWVAFYKQIAIGTLTQASLGICLAALVLAGIICYALFYRVPATLGMKTGYPLYVCLLYTSDAADDLLCVDLGGRRIIKKK